MMLVSACDISRRSNCARIGSLFDLGFRYRCRDVRPASGTRLPHGVGDISPSITGFGIPREARETIDHTPDITNCRTIVSVHCSKTALSR